MSILHKVYKLTQIKNCIVSNLALVGSTVKKMFTVPVVVTSVWTREARLGNAYVRRGGVTVTYGEHALLQRRVTTTHLSPQWDTNMRCIICV